MPILEVRNISKKFGNTEVLKDISFSLDKGESFPSSGHLAVVNDFLASEFS